MRKSLKFLSQNWFFQNYRFAVGDRRVKCLRFLTQSVRKICQFRRLIWRPNWKSMLDSLLLRKTSVIKSPKLSFSRKWWKNETSYCLCKFYKEGWSCVCNLCVLPATLRESFPRIPFNAEHKAEKLWIPIFPVFDLTNAYAKSFFKGVLRVQSGFETHLICQQSCPKNGALS